MNLFRSCLLLALLAAFTSNLSPQIPPEPSDPGALMSVARERNDLHGPNVRPWHVHGTYRILGKKEAVEDSGIFEEWWISPTKYKRMFAGKSFSQIDYANGEGLFRAGAQDWPTGTLMLLHEALVDPIPGLTQLQDFKLEKTTVPVGQTTLTCVVMTFPVRENVRLNDDTFPTACFDPKLPVLRISSSAGCRTVRDQLAGFQGHYLAKQIRLYFSGELRAELTLDTVENLADPGDALTAPPAEAKPVDVSSIVLNEETSARFPRRLKVAVPEYPPIARNIRAEGTVVLEGTLGSDGRTSDLKAIGGPPVLYQAALDAVGQWIYLPFEVMGQPRTVKLKIKVIFSLG